jgi:hypothetical protein
VHPELVEERSEGWYVLVVADAWRDGVDAEVGNHHQPRRLVGGFAVGLCPEAIGGHGIRGLELGGGGGSVKRGVAELCVVDGCGRGVPFGAAELPRQPFRRGWNSRIPGSDEQLRSRVSAVEDGTGLGDAEACAVSEPAQQSDNVRGDGFRAWILGGQDGDRLTGCAGGGNQLPGACEPLSPLRLLSHLKRSWTPGTVLPGSLAGSRMPAFSAVAWIWIPPAGRTRHETVVRLLTYSSRAISNRVGDSRFSGGAGTPPATL